LPSTDLESFLLDEKAGLAPAFLFCRIDARNCCPLLPKPQGRPGNPEETVDGRNSLLEFNARSSYVLSINESGVRSRPFRRGAVKMRGPRAVELPAELPWMRF
jgi:hypothetical protein